jgi:4-hydroxy-tetrahydrodipicolinate reductase
MRKLVIFGVTGRMGQALLRALRVNPELRLCGAISHAGSERLGKDAVTDGEPIGIAVAADAAAALRGADVALDFSLPQAVAAHVRACADAGVPIVVAATGLDAAAQSQITEASKRIAVLVAPNTSVGVNVTSALVAQAAKLLGNGYDVEVCEAHHKNKRDAPSGTALALGEAVAAARGQTLSNVAEFDRHGSAQARRPGGIGFSVVRAGDIVGEHTVVFAAEGERIEITHRATDRMIFARGALRAAEWLAGRPAGLYGMQHVLGLP